MPQTRPLLPFVWTIWATAGSLKAVLKFGKPRGDGMRLELVACLLVKVRGHTFGYVHA